MLPSSLLSFPQEAARCSLNSGLPENYFPPEEIRLISTFHFTQFLPNFEKYRCGPLHFPDWEMATEDLSSLCQPLLMEAKNATVPDPPAHAIHAYKSCAFPEAFPLQ